MSDTGDLVYVKIFGISILFVNSYELARELFDKRGHIYSDRAHSVVLNDLYVHSFLMTVRFHSSAELGWIGPYF